MPSMWYSVLLRMIHASEQIDNKLSIQAPVNQMALGTVHRQSF